MYSFRFGFLLLEERWIENKSDYGYREVLEEEKAKVSYLKKYLLNFLGRCSEIGKCELMNFHVIERSTISRMFTTTKIDWIDGTYVLTEVL